MSAAQPSERLEVIKQICKEKKYHFEYVDNFTQLLAKISVDNKITFFNFSQYPINNATSSTLVRDKAFTYLLLEKAGFKIPQGDYFFGGAYACIFHFSFVINAFFKQKAY